jgi:hypothetical protein
MAISANAVYEVRTTGTQTGGGLFVTGASGSDFSQQDAPQYDITDASAAGAGQVITTTAAAADMVGNGLFAVGGTNVTANKRYEILSVVVGTSITVAGASNLMSGAGSGDVHVHIGGAFAFGGALDDEFHEDLVAGNKVYVQNGTHTFGEAVSMAADGSVTKPITFIGYKTTRSTIPTGSDRPILDGGANNYVIAGNYVYYDYITFTTTASSGINPNGTGNIFYQCKATNTSESASRYAFKATGYNVTFIQCEEVSKKGMAFGVVAGTSVINCYAHDSNYGLYVGAAGAVIKGNIIESCYGACVYITASYALTVIENTIRAGLCGIQSDGSDYSDIFISNIIADCITGANWTSSVGSNFWTNNCWDSITTDVTNVVKGTTDITQDPLLASGVVIGTDGVTNAAPGLTFTAASNPFLGVTSSDCLVIVEAGTGAALGCYTISSVDGIGQLTLATSPGASKANIDYIIVKGTDFTLSAGSPCFNAGLTLGTVCGL